MARPNSVFAWLFTLLLWTPLAQAQDKSVKPGINDSFRDPDVKEFVGKFEIESREVFVHRAKIVEACQLKPGLTVADIGAGTGLFTRLFAEAVGPEGRVLAVDISQKFLDHIVETSRQAGHRNVETRLCTADSTGLPPDSVDVAFICDTYHHFEFPHKTLASLHRALKPGGRVVLIDFRREEGESSDWVLSHVRAGQQVFTFEIIDAGFRMTRVEQDLLKENYFVVFEKGKSRAKSPLVFPIIAGHGGVVPRPTSAEQPRQGAKVVLDVTADAKPAEIHKGLDRAARLLNLYGAAGLKGSDVAITLVFHGEATKTVLNDAAYRERFGIEKNPNLALLKELKQAGVDLLVCGQALHYKEFADADVSQDVSIAVSALTVIVNRQSEGYAYIPVP